jgi:polyphosphate kinase 2 (PPK2 family)
VQPNIWDQRFKEIRNFESYLAGNGILVRKFFLHVSQAEQQRRFLARIDDPNKNWKFSANDAKARDYWDDYMKAYEETIRNTATGYAPWYVVPADNKWFTRVVVAAAVIEGLSSLHLAYPKLDKEQQKELEAAKHTLMTSNDH